MVLDIASGSCGHVAFLASHWLLNKPLGLMCGAMWIPCQCLRHPVSPHIGLTEATATEDANPYLEHVFVSIKVNHCAFQCERGLRSSTQGAVCISEAWCHLGEEALLCVAGRVDV